MTVIIVHHSRILMVVVQVDFTVNPIFPGCDDVNPFTDWSIAQRTLIHAPSLCSNSTEALILHPRSVTLFLG